MCALSTVVLGELYRVTLSGSNNDSVTSQGSFEREFKNKLVLTDYAHRYGLQQK